MQSIIKKTAVHFTAEPTRSRAGSATTGDTHGVELLQRDGVVHGLQVRCSCGEVTTVEFDYAAEPNGGGKPSATSPAPAPASPPPAPKVP